MTEEKTGDERSMSEILASIRKIVTDEERTRRAAERQRSESAGEGAAPVLELTEAMRAAPAEADAEPEADPNDTAPDPATEPDGAAPLDLGDEAVLVSAPGAAGKAQRPDPHEPALHEPNLQEIEAIVRRVVREELKGPVGLEISRKVKASIHEEVRRALADDEPLI